MLFKKHAKSSSMNVLFDLASILLSFLILGPLATFPNTTLYSDKGGFLETLIEEQISEALPDYSVEIEQVEISSFLSLSPVETKIHNIHISGPKGQFTSPETIVSFDFRSAFLKGISYSVKLNDVQISLDSTVLNPHYADAELSDQTEIFSQFLSDILKEKNVVHVPKHVEISVDEIRVLDGNNTKNSKILVKDASLNASRSGFHNLQAMVTAQTLSAGKIDASIGANLKTLDWQITTNIQTVNIGQFRDYMPVSIQDVLAEGIFSGEVNAQFNAAQLLAVDGHFDSQKLELHTSPQEHIDVSQFSGWFAYDASEKNATFSNLVMSLTPNIKIKAAIQLENAGDSEVLIKASAEIRDTLIEEILPYLNGKPFRQINQLISHYTSGGIVDFATLSLSAGSLSADSIFAGNDAAEDSFEWHDLQLDGQISELEITATNKQYKKLKAKTKNHFSALLGKGGRLNKLILKSKITDGIIRLHGSDNIVENITGKLDFSFDGDKVQNASIRLTQADVGDVLFKAEFPSTDVAMEKLGEKTGQQFWQKFSNRNKSILTAISFETEMLDAGLLFEVWPEQIGTETRQWLSRRGRGGEIIDAKVKAFIELPVLEKQALLTAVPDSLQIVGLSGNWGWENVNFTWTDGSPTIGSVALQSRIFNNRLSVEILNGNLPFLRLKNGQVELYPVLGYGDKTLKRNLEIDATIIGDIPAFKKLLDDPTINRLPDEIKNLSNPAGMIVSKIATKSELQNKKLKLNSLSAEATLSDVSFGNLPLNETMSEGNIEISLQEDGKILINGSGKISGVASTFTAQRSEDKTVKLVVKASPSEYLSNRIGDFTKVDISGNSAIKLHLEYDTYSKSGIADIAADLQETAIDLPLLNWAKFPGEVGELEALVEFSDNTVKNVKITKALFGTSHAEAVLEMSPNFAISRATLKNVKFPGYDIDELIVTIDDDNALDVVAEGGLIDATFLLRTTGLSEKRKIAFELSSARLQLATNITLQGALVGDIDKFGSGTALLNGSLFIEQSPLIEEATIEASFDTLHETLSGTGLIGGAEATLSYSSTAADTSQLVIRSQNAGRTLLGLNILDTIRGGELLLINTYKNKEFDNFNTKIRVTDFSVIEAPKSLRALSVLSVSGLYSLIEGDGTKFAVGIADIETNGQRRILNDVRASGEAIKFQLAGEYDRQTDEIQVRGILAPLSLISDIIGFIPLVRNIITGQDKTGLLATQFEMSGQLSDPVTTINPATVLAPGAIRNILSPGWLTKESGIRLEPLQQD
mgnify:FL=1